VADERGIYVEILIRATADQIWRATQTPGLHQQWDLRFSEIDYLPKAAEFEPQRFRYATRIGFGLRIEGEGESTGTREDTTGLRTSALKFRSEDRKSLIREGSGYWRYIPTDTGVRFLTWYDYRTRFGIAGAIFDRLVFRPLIGWATAWSFDRLRLWLDEGTRPEASRRMAAIHAMARVGTALVWLWQGIVPKLLLPSADERAMLGAAGLPASTLPYIGAAEVLFGLALLAFWRRRSLLLWNVFLMAAALAATALRSPSYLFAAFNPVSLNAAVALLSVAGYWAAADAPSASRCLRRPPKE
jgi:hypothetical protein